MPDQHIFDEAKALKDVENMFDSDYYRTRYADICANPQIDPFRHFCTVGWREGRDPTNWFSTNRYLAGHPDVATAGVNPFIHYILVRRDEFRRLRRIAKGIIEPLEYTVDAASVDRFGILHVSGWIVSFAPLQEIAISFNGQKLGFAEYGLLRDDVGAVFSNYPESGRSGFSFVQELETDDLSNPSVTVDITLLGGIKRQQTVVPTVPQTIKRRQFRNNAIQYSVDALSLTEDGNFSADGWVISGDGIESVTVELDDEPLGDAVIGLPRPDVGNVHPLVRNSRWSGFRFHRKLDGAFKGEHHVVLILRSSLEEKVIPLPLAVTDAQRDSGVIEFFIDSPKIDTGQAIEPVYGDMSVVGWAVAPTGIDHIEIFLDGESKGNAYFGARRNDIQVAFPTMLDSAKSGFGISIPKRWEPGDHQIRLAVHDRSGNVRYDEFIFEARASDAAESWQLRRKVKQAETDIHLNICKRLRHEPEFLLLMRLLNTSEKELLLVRQTILRLQDQSYARWRLLIVLPDGVTSLNHFGWLDDSRIGTIGRSASAPWLSGGDPAIAMVGFLRPGDDFGVDALQEIAVEAALHRDATIIYGDERRYDHATQSMSAFFKPDWSPDLLLSTNYIGRFWFARATALQAVGFSIANLDRGEYDVLLRLTDDEPRVHHVPKLLCTAHGLRIDSPEQERRALTRAVRRRKIAATVMKGFIPHAYRVKRAVKTDDLISIIIPTIAAKGLIKGVITSIRERTTYPKIEIIVIDGIAPDHELKAWVQEHADKIVVAPKKFNWSRCNNLGADVASGEYLVFLNDDMEIIDPDWLHALKEHAERPEVGVVGPLLLYPEGKIQHAGMVLMEAGGKHVFRFAEADDPGPFGLIQMQRNMIGVTGACMMMSRSVFEFVGRFDEAHTVINNDMDFCLRSHKKGLRVVYTPHTRLIHYEESSRALLPDDYDASRFDNTWKRVFALGDPYTSPNLAREMDGYRAESEPTEILHVGHPVIATDNVKRIVVVKLDHIGDFITAIPAFNRLKELFPNAEVTALVGKTSGALARETASIDHVIEFGFFHAQSGKGRQRLSKKKLAELEEKLKLHRFDIAIDLRQHMDTRHMLKYTGAKWLAGYDLRGSAPWLDISLELVIDSPYITKRHHVSDALIQMVDAVATACNSHRMVFPSMSQAEARAKFASLPALAPIAENLFKLPVVCIHPGVGSAIRQWPPEHFAGLADLLIEGEGVNVIVVGSPDELKIVDQVIKKVRHKDSIFSLVGKTRVADLPCVLQSSDLFIGNNSGPHHLAAGLGVPTIGVHSYVVDAAEWGPLGPNAIAIRRDMNCGPCYLEKVTDCHREHACMRGLRPRDVYASCQRLLALHKEKH